MRPLPGRAGDVDAGFDGGGTGRECASCGNQDLRGLGPTDRPLATAHLDPQRVTERCDRDDADLDAGHETHLEQAAAERTRPVDAGDRRCLSQRNLGERRRHA
jgi:hypothetical protein